jgi:23S rRNA (adenine2503-C2)-methyltransferase
MKHSMTSDTRTERIPIKSLTPGDIESHFLRLGQPRYRAAQVLDWIYSKRVDDFAAMTNLPAPLRDALSDAFSADHLDPVRVLGSDDSTRKYLFRLADGNLIETVLIPASPALYGEASDRRTLCVSTQVGCAYGCRFCASGLDGWKRDLGPEEIVEQILAAERASGEKVNNVVFMGMGEPLANLKNVMRAIDIINGPWGIGIGARHITVSTSGLAPQIRSLADDPRQVRLAVSLHAASDAVRETIMPVNRKFDLAALLDACTYFSNRKKQKITFEYILIDGINDSPDQATRLAAIVRRLAAKVNLIPWNSVPGLEWSRPPEDRQEAFLEILLGRGVAATLRREKGHDIAAACGQLRLQTEREPASTEP